MSDRILRAKQPGLQPHNNNAWNRDRNPTHHVEYSRRTIFLNSNNYIVQTTNNGVDRERTPGYENFLTFSIGLLVLTALSISLTYATVYPAVTVPGDASVAVPQQQHTPKQPPGLSIPDDKPLTDAPTRIPLKNAPTTS